MLKKLQNNPWWLAIIGGAIATLVANLIWDIHWVEYALKLGRWLLGILNYSIPIWIILSSLIIIFFILRIIKTIKNSNIAPPEFLKYKQDRFKSWTWKWEYTKSRDGRWNITDLRPYCPSCDTRMQYVSSSHGSRASCPQCSYLAHSEPLMIGYTPNFEQVSDIELLIINKLERN